MRYLAPVFSVRKFKDSPCCDQSGVDIICWFNDETGRCFKRSCFRWAAAASDMFTWSVCKRSQRADVFHLQWQSSVFNPAQSSVSYFRRRFCKPDTSQVVISTHQDHIIWLNVNVKSHQRLIFAHISRCFVETNRLFVTAGRIISICDLSDQNRYLNPNHDEAQRCDKKENINLIESRTHLFWRVI